jgi:hypothetical protein
VRPSQIERVRYQGAHVETYPILAKVITTFYYLANYNRDLKHKNAGVAVYLASFLLIANTKLQNLNFLVRQITEA